MKYKAGTFITVPNRDHIRGLKANVQSVYVWLCARTDVNGTCYPSFALLAKEAGVCTRTALKCVDELENLGLIKRQQRRDDAGDLTSNLYRIIDKGWAPNAPQVRQQVREGMATDAEITKPIEINKKEEVSSSDDNLASSFNKKNLGEVYAKNQAYLQNWIANKAFEEPPYQFQASGPYDWRYAMKSRRLTPELFMLALFWRERDKYTYLTEQFGHSYTFITKHLADVVIARDLPAAKKLARAIIFHDLKKLFEYATDKAYDEKKHEAAWEVKIGTLLRYVDEFDYSKTVN